MPLSGNHSKTIQGYADPAGYEQLTSLAAAAGLAAIPAGAKFAIIQPESQNVRWRDDAVDPTAAVGMIIVANDTMIYSGPLASLKFIQTAASAKINVIYYK